ncbi:MAG: PRC-barrel domain-containing protein [Nanoarchaeota archaeon]|nr:PRC-barrel domain-containing protein [Nanoarchaeota archaeon]
MYPLSVRVGNVNNDSLDEIIVGGYGGGRYWILNTSGDIIGQYYYGFESDYVFGDYIGITYAKSPGIDIVNDSNGDGINEIVVARATGFFSVGQQVTCMINITGHYREEYMYYNYTSKLYEYYYPLDYLVMEDVQNNKTFNWTVKCEKGGYELQELTSNLTAFTKITNLTVFDEEDDSENDAGWLTETSVIPNQNTYFFANYTDLEVNAPVTEITVKPKWHKDIGGGYGFYDLISADFDGDKRKESFVYTALDSIYAFSSEGDFLWSKGDLNYEYIYDLTSGDFNNDSYDEIAGVGSLGYIIILDRNGTQIYPYNNFRTGYTIAKGDLNDDGITDIIAGVGDVFASMAVKPGIVGFAWNTSASSFQTIFVANDTVLFQPVEIRVAEIHDAPNRVAYVDYTGAEKAYVYYGNKTFIYQTAALTTTASSLKFFDYYGDGTEDDLIIGDTGNIRMYNSTGSSIRTDTTPSYAVSEIETIDYDGDGIANEYVYYQTYSIALENKAGTQLWSYSLPNDYWGSLEVNDINNDGQKEIIVSGGTTGTIYIFNKTGSLLTKSSAIFPNSMSGEDLATLNNNYYGANTGIDFTDSVNGRKYLGFAAENSNVGTFEIFPECIIRFEDGLTKRMFYNISAGLYYFNRTFSSSGGYDWNITCKSINHLNGISTLKTLNINPILDINLTYPENNSYFNNELSEGSILLNATVFDLLGNLNNLTVWFYGGYSNGTYSLLNTTYNQTNGTSATYNWTGLSLGEYNWSVITNNETANSSQGFSYFNIINLTINCEAGGPYGQNALVLIHGNVSDGISALSLQSINVSIYKSNVLETNTSLNSSSTGIFQTTFSNLISGSYVLNISTTYQGYNKSCTDNFQLGGSASLLLDKIISLNEINSTNIIYNITLKTINNGGSNATSVILNDTDSSESPYSLGTLTAENFTLTSYLKSYTRNSTNYNVTLAIASVNGTDLYSGNEISANSSEITLIIPSTTADTKISLTKNVQYLEENETSVTYNLTSDFINSGGNDLTGIEIKDSDISLDDSINLNRTQNYSTSGTKIINKISESQQHNFLKSNATYDSITYESNEISILIPSLKSNASLLLTKYALIDSSTDINITYNITINLANKGGINATNAYIYDDNFSLSPYNVGILQSEEVVTASYLLTLDKGASAVNYALPIATANATDSLNGELIEASSDQISVYIPALPSSAAFVLDKIASFYNLTNETFTYNITLRLTNKGGSNATNVNITDNDYSDYNFSIENMSSGETITRSYLINFTRNSTTYYNSTSIARAYGIDLYSNNLISANSSSINLTIPSQETGQQLTVLKNIWYNNQSSNDVNYTIIVQVINSGGVDLTGINVQDLTDLSLNTWINLNKSQDYNYSGSLIISKAQSNTEHAFSIASASVNFETYTSNKINVLIPGFGGGPNDVKVYAPSSVTASTNFDTVINITNINPDIGQDFTITYWITNDAETLNYTSSGETMYIAATQVNSTTVTLQSPNSAGTYRFRALVTGSGVTTPATSFDAFDVTSAGAGAGAGGSGSGITETPKVTVPEEQPLIIGKAVKELLFDTNLRILDKYKEVNAGDIITAEITIYNVGENEEKRDTLVTYFIKDLDGKILSSESETIAINTKTNFVKEIYIPRNLKPGEYIFEVEIKYNSLVSKSSSRFNIIKETRIGEAAKIITLTNLFYILIPIIVLILFIILVRFLSQKKRVMYNGESKLYEQKKVINSYMDKAVKNNQVEIKNHYKKTLYERLKDAAGIIFNISAIPKKENSIKWLMNKRIYTDSGRHLGLIEEVIIQGDRIYGLKIKLNKKQFSTKGIIITWKDVVNCGEIVIVNSEVLNSID